MAQGTLKIHTENLLPIIKKWLYSEKEIFVRELISNACDALQKCKILQGRGEMPLTSEELRIDVQIDKNARTLTFEDTGIGMSGEEVEKYIAQIAFSGAQEFMETYQQKEQIIGHFGLGFYSSYMVAENVEIETLSYKENAEPAHWSCTGTSDYDLSAGKRSQRGTQIILHLDKENEEFLEESRIRGLLQHYCAFLPFPIYLNGKHLNSNQPLWLKNPSECTDKEYLDFYHTLYPNEADPICWVHLNVDYPFHLQGILYFPKVGQRFDWNKNALKLFCNRVFVSDSCKDLLPDYLVILRGAIDSPDIPLNVSRSTLQTDRTVRQLSQYISKKISERLTTLFTTDREQFLKAWPEIEIIIKLGMLQDEKFYDRTKELLVWKTSNETWTTAEEYLERHKTTYKGKIFYTTADQEHSHCLHLYKEKGIEVVIAPSPVDAPLFDLLERKLEEATFQRIDGGLNEAILDASREKTLLDAEGKTIGVRIADFLRSKLSKQELTIEAKSLSSDSVHAFLVIDEATRRLRDTLALTQPGALGMFPAKRTFVVNTNSALIQSLNTLKESKPQLAEEIALHLYDLALLSQKELSPSELPSFIERSHKIMESMARSQPDQ